MHPLLIDFGGPFKLHTYGLFMALAFVTAIYISWREAVRTGLEDPDDILDLAFWILISAMVGSRILFIIVNWDDYARDPIAIFKFWQGGLVFYGGFIGAVSASWIFMRKRGMNFWKVADIAIPTVAIGQSLGRLGCFAAGCCYGQVCHLPWAAHFPPGSLTYSDLQQRIAAGHIDALDASEVGIHPTQLYESTGTLLIFFLLLVVRSRKRFHGQVLLTYLMIYPILRSTIETLRGDIERGFVIDGVISTSQFISICVVSAAIAAAAYLRKHRPGQSGPTPAPA